MWIRWLIAISLVALLSGRSALAQQLDLGPIYEDAPGQVAVVVELPIGVTPKAEDFRLLMDGEVAAIAHDLKSFRDSGRGLSWLLCIDVSGTMADRPPDRPLTDTKRALLSFLADRRPQDRIALMSFATQINILADFVDGPENLQRRIDELKAGGPRSQTRLYQALYEALDRLNDEALPKRRRILLVSDGKDEGSSAGPDSVIKKARVLDVAIDAIGRGRIAEQYVESLRYLARNTGGHFVHAQPQEISLTDAFERIRRQVMETRTVVAYFNYQAGAEENFAKQANIELQQPGTIWSGSVAAQLPLPQKEPEPEPEPEPPNWILWLLTLVLALAITGLILFFTRKKPKPARPPIADETPISISEPTPEPKPDREDEIHEHERARQTMVGGVFPSPESGQFKAILVGISGAVQGQRVTLDKEVFHIGADPDNDLSIPDDDYISGSHAYLRYEQGSLLIYDQNSRNGTFVNDARLGEAGVLLHPGDRIRVGNSTFEILQAAEGSEGSEEGE